MSEVRNRQNNPCPELDFQEIYLPDERDFGTGTLRLRAKKNTLTPPVRPGPKAISSIVFNPPRFQIAATINPGTKEIPINLGRADGSNPVSQVVFLLPARLDTAKSHEFLVTFEKWQVLSMTMDGTALEQKPRKLDD